MIPIKKELKLILIIGFILVGFSIALPFILNSLKQQTEQSVGYIRIYVNSAIYSQIYNQVEQYKNDVSNQGFSVDIINWSIFNVVTLKNDILNASLNRTDFKGVVLIGTFPAAFRTHYVSGWGNFKYPCDLFLTDLDGNWTDPDGDLIYEIHTNGTGDVLPDIFLGRINPYPISGINHVKALKNYFKRNHEYRTNILNRSHSALLYIDDDWSAYSNEWLSNFTAYSNITMIDNNYITAPTDYKYQLSNRTYEFVHLMVHSWDYEHQFHKPSPSFPFYTVHPLNYTEIYNLYTKPLFYNLFACFACNFTKIDNMGTHYLFSNNTLAVIGSSRSGGMFLYQPFYDSLKSGKTIGEAFKTWFHNHELITFNHWNDSLGMTILGDPLLTIYM